jgi:uncharacterized protein (DUF433 family)
MATAQKNKHPSHLGVGLYSQAEASRLLGISPATLARWIHPETRLITRRFADDEHTLSFLELMELHFIDLFRAEGVPLRVIRETAVAASRRFQSDDYPFCVKRFDTDGRTIFATLIDHERNAEQVEELRHGQRVFEEIVRPFFRKLDYGQGTQPVRFWPLEILGRIVLDPERKFGKPIDFETGVPTSAIVDALRAGEGQAPQDVAAWLDIPLAAVQAALAFEQSLEESVAA